MQKLLTLILILTSFRALADGSVRFAELEEDLGAGAESVVRVNDGGGSFFFATFDEPAGDGTSTSSPGISWFPVKNGNLQEDNVTIATKTLVPEIRSPSNGLIQTYLRLTNNTGSIRYLYAAVQDPDNSSNYKVVALATGPYASQASVFLAWSQIEIENLCTIVDCTNLRSGTSATKNVLVYYFLDSQSNRGLDTDISPSSETGGVFLRLNMSARIPSSSITLQDIRRGDGRVVAVFTGTTISDFRRTLAVVNGTGANLPDNDTIQAAFAVSGTNLLDIESAATSGEVTIRPLVNGVDYEAAILFEDKFQFATKISNVLQARPELIEALLEKQACYILSAGFQEEHFITDFFRSIRDKILLKTQFGMSFVDWYYSTAPVYAPLVYSSPLLAFVVRCAAFALWFIINFALLIGVITLVIALFKKLSPRRANQL